MRSYYVAAIALSLVAVAHTSSAKPAKNKKAPTKVAVPSNELAAPAPAPTPIATPAPAPEPAPTVAKTPAPAPVADSVDPDRAEAIANAESNPISVAPLLGVSAGMLGFGAGLRAGYTLSSHVYLGAQFMYHFGKSVESFGFERSNSYFYPAAEGGYDIRLGRLVIRPYGGLAMIVYNSSWKALGEEHSSSVSSLGIYPGCAVSYDIPKSSIFVGGDARLLFDMDGGGSSFAAYGSAGMRF